MDLQEKNDAVHTPNGDVGSKREMERVKSLHANNMHMPSPAYSLYTLTKSGLNALEERITRSPA